jgi:uncharacterized protein (TIGR03437 family)
MRAILFALLAVAAQVCRVSVAGINQNRRVSGPVHAECPVSIHTPPFGNWGVTSNFGQKGNSRQFDGWCHDSIVCDNSGNCKTECRDGWYEWNSCTDIAQYRPPNCTLYNLNCTEQISTTGINVHGTRTVDLPVSCPVDTNGDGTPDEGGCRDLTTFSNGANFMSLYELDPGSSDSLIQTVYFPEVPVAMDCDVFACRSAASPWLTPIFFDSPSSPAKVYAEMAVVINSGTFIDSQRACAIPMPAANILSSASYQAGIAPDSMASAFGSGLATATASANSNPLPEILGGTRVSITDAAGQSRAARLFYVSPQQVNFLVPSDLIPGPAAVTIRRSDGIVVRGAASIGHVAPGLFSANGDGRGVAAAYAIRVRADGTQEYVTVYQCGGPGTCAAIPVPVPNFNETVILVLYGTGIRRAGLSSVRVDIGGIAAAVHYAGPQFQYEGLDQVNVAIPASLAGRGAVSVRLHADGETSNAVSISIR